MLFPFDPSRHKLLPLYWATEEGFELGLPLSDLREQSLLIGAAAGSLLLSRIKRREKPRSLFNTLKVCETVVRHRARGRKRSGDLILQLNRKLIAMLIRHQNNGNTAHFGP